MQTRLAVLCGSGRSFAAKTSKSLLDLRTLMGKAECDLAALDLDNINEIPRMITHRDGTKEQSTCQMTIGAAALPQRRPVRTENNASAFGFIVSRKAIDLGYALR